ncbi:hypothetical protein V8C86DRAFT_2442551, partial [Haematococcus lacustris]
RAHILYDGGQLGLLKFPISRERAPYEALYNQLSLYRVIEYVQLGLLDHRRVITMKDLQDTGCVSKEIKNGVMLYGSELRCTVLGRAVATCMHICCLRWLQAKGQLAVPLHLQASVWVVTLAVSVDMVALPELYTAKRLPLPLPAHSWHPRHQDKFDAIGQIDLAKIVVNKA